MRTNLILSIVLVGLALTHPAHAQPQPIQILFPPLAGPAPIGWRKGALEATLPARGILTSAVVAKMDSGLDTFVVMYVYVVPRGAFDPVALAVRVCRVQLDLWDQMYRVERTEAGRSTSSASMNVAGVERICLGPRTLRVMESTVVASGASISLAVVVDVEPPSPILTAAKRRASTAGTGAIRAGDPLFGFTPSALGPSLVSVRFGTNAFAAP